MRFSPIDWFYIPKAKYLQRRCAYIEPVYVVKYLSLVLTIADKIETSRLNRQRGIVHSYRYNKNGAIIFSEKYNYSTFRKKSAELSARPKYTKKIITDISDFYDRVNLHRIESQLLSIGCDPQIVSKLNELLMTWSGRDSYGLPVGGNASRILAEAALIDIDRYLVSQGIPYVRFVDDFRIFAESNDQAAYFLQLLQSRLAEDGLTLNPAKTSVLGAFEDELESASPPPKPDEGPEVKREEEDRNDIAARRFAFDVYKGKLPLTYRNPSEEKAEELKALDVDKAMESFEKIGANNVEFLRDILRAIAFQNKNNAADTIYDLSRNNIELIPYIVDMVISNEDIKSEVKLKISDLFGKWLLDGSQKPDYMVSSFVRIVLTYSKNGKFILSRYLETLPRDGSGIIGRELFLTLLPEIERSELLRFKKFYWRATLAERRALIKGFIANRSVHRREKEPWLKSIRSVNSDPFIDIMIAKQFAS